MLRFIFSIHFILCICFHSAADSITAGNRQRPLAATAQITGLNVGIWAFDRYVERGDYAYISMNSIAENFRKGLIWDNDRLETNMLMHPFHGSLYYSSARSNGFNYWQSGVFALGGSAMWEFIMEREYPSTNDIIATPVGGMILGEVLFRCSDILLDNRTSGWDRATREIAAGILSPMRGITRIFNGDAWRKGRNPGRMYEQPDYSIDISSGLRCMGTRHNIGKYGAGATVQINIEYGDTKNQSSEKPFDYFSLGSSFNLQRSQPLLGRVNISGRLFNKGLLQGHSTDLNIGFYQHFDYYACDSMARKFIPYKIGIPASLGIGSVVQSSGIASAVDLEAMIHFNGVILGGVLSDHYNVDERDYNFASGFNLQASLGVDCGSWLSARLSHKFFRLYSWKGYDDNHDWNNFNPKTLNVQGDMSMLSMFITEFSIGARLFDNWYVTLSFTDFYRKTDYRIWETVSSHSIETCLMLSYRI